MSTIILAPCGIDCSTCDIYIAAHDPDAAQRLAEAWKAGGNANATPEWFKCRGCRGDRTLCWSEDCRIQQCATEKGVDYCSQCVDFPCEKYLAWVGNWGHHQQAFERLKAMASES